ncbi:denticleless protein homolog isoform X2 [Phoenix dactylifera]|uniref:Denticleless protein homolog isoform X2 n=1 Tax=Phoenix dactylifera TaxID=42345 RepID=A0A8B8J4R2_PHODC|nr:denticleless protein homolog isoform X2 [Phoenix dactylifera]
MASKVPPFSPLPPPLAVPILGAPNSGPSSIWFLIAFSPLPLASLVRKRPYLGDLSSEPSGLGTGVVAIEHDGVSTPPLAISFCKTSRNSHLLAVSDEDGYLSFYNTCQSLGSVASCWEKAVEARVCDWIAHNNAIFDVCWIKDDNHILTASGDQTIKIWNVEKRKCTGILVGHTGSVKSLCSHSSNPDLVVSGSRDGSFALWDLRCESSYKNTHGEICLGYTAVVKEAHTSIQGKRVRRGKAGSMSITSVLYLKDNVSLASAGAVDSVVKFWDTRNLKSPVTQACPYVEPSLEKERGLHGISCLSQDSNGVFVAASCMDNRIYLYDVLHLDKGPMKIFSGSKIESFFVKSAISPDGAYILGGSSDGNAYIWQVRKPEGLPVMLKGHEGEVTAVDWCSSEIGKIATTSDDFMVRVWNFKKGGCISSGSPKAVRKRVIAPNTEGRKLAMDEHLYSTEMADSLCASREVATNPHSPVQTKSLEFSTPESGKKTHFRSLLGEEEEMQKSPDAELSSPSSVLNPPPSLKRRTIRDYFIVAP